MKQFIVDHYAAIGLAALYVFTAMVAALPSPGDSRPMSQKLYQWMYDCLHILSNRAVEKRPSLSAPAPSQPISPAQS